MKPFPLDIQNENTCTPQYGWISVEENWMDYVLIAIGLKWFFRAALGYHSHSIVLYTSASTFSASLWFALVLIVWPFLLYFSLSVNEIVKKIETNGSFDAPFEIFIFEFYERNEERSFIY